MRTTAGTCPSEAALLAFAAGEPSASTESHLASCETCRGLVDAARKDDLLAGEFRAAIDATPARPVPLEPHQGRLDDYELGPELARGAQGVVHEAFHRPTKRRCAIKILLRGPYATPRQLARFEREVELAASLKHPGIVTIYDSGRTESDEPFVAMELVEGETLDAYVRRVRPSRRDLLTLFAGIAEAVQAAHERAVIHRDLKPSNILVDASGAPHILDFGIAKAAGAAAEHTLTRQGDFVGTLAYASPEQVTGDPDAVGTRSDVYALGVILYELLTGTRPSRMDGSLAEAVHTITAVAPPDPSSHANVPRELALITLKALEKDPKRRYPSAGAMAGDIRRFLENRPISVRADSTWYVVSKAISRHRTAVSIAAAAILSLASFAVIARGQARRAALAESAKARAAEAFVGSLTQMNQEESDARITSVAEFLDEATAIVRHQFSEHPQERVALNASLAMAYLSRASGPGDFDKAETLLADALDNQRRAAADGPPGRRALAEVLLKFGELRWKQNRYQEAADSFREAVDLAAAVGDHALTGDARHRLAGALTSLRRQPEAEAMYREAITVKRLASGEDSLPVANSLMMLSICVREQGRVDEAVNLSREALAIVRKAAGVRDWRVARILGGLATYLSEAGRDAEAEECLAESLAIKREWKGSQDPDVATTLLKLARLKATRHATNATPDDRAGLLAGVDIADEGLAIRRKLYAGDHERLAEAIMERGLLRLRAGQLDAAELDLRDALEMRLRLLPVTDRLVARSDVLLGECLTRLGRLDDALTHLERGLAHTEAARGPKHPLTMEAVARLADLHATAGRSDQADILRARLKPQ